MGPRRRRVTWTETALRGLDSSIAFVARESIENAHRLLERVIDAADSLRMLGERGTPVPEYGVRVFANFLWIHSDSCIA
jgi:plasmid stabilization system protein ParE